MRIRTRRLFFYALVAVFILLGGYLALSAGGWVLNLKTFRVEKTGALFLKFAPRGAQIYLDGKLQTASAGFLSSGVFIPNLVPGNYGVRVASDGYAAWTENLSVDSGLVTSASQIELWPDAWPIRSAATGTVPDFWLTSAGAILQNRSGALRLDGSTLQGKSVVLSDQSSNAIVTTDGQSYFWINLSEPENAVNVTDLFNALRQTQLGLTGTVPISGVFFHPFSGNRLIISSAKAVYLLDLRQMKLTLLFKTGGIAAMAVSENEVFALDASSTLDIFNLLLQTTNEFPIDAASISKMAVTPEGGTLFMLQKDGTLSEYDRSGQTLLPLTKGVADFWLSPGEERLALLSSGGQLSILAIKDYWNDDQFTAGENWTVAVPGGAPDDFAWLPDYPGYGLTLAGGTLSVVELGDRTPQNTSIISDGVSKFYLSGSNLFFLKGQTLESVDLGSI